MLNNPLKPPVLGIAAKGFLDAYGNLPYTEFIGRINHAFLGNRYRR
jgi:hypothetical protein